MREAIKRLVFRGLGMRQRLRGDASGSVLLTFDDGPEPAVTPAVLDRLAGYGARAVFFVVGERATSHPSILRRILTEGHVIGNHTFTHHRHRFGAVGPYVRDVRQCQDAVAEATGYAPRLFRPPHGRITLGSVVGPRVCRLSTVHWSLDPRDYRLKSVEEAAGAGQALGGAAAGGDIVLLHDINPHLLTLLDVLLPRLASRGFDLARGPELL